MNRTMQQPSAIGRNWKTADRAELTTFPEGDAMVHLYWSDGARIDCSQDDEQQARETLRQLGFAASKGVEVVS